MRCAQCGRFIGEDCTEGHNGSLVGSFTGDDGYTGIYYCAPNVGCQIDPHEDECDEYIEIEGDEWASTYCKLLVGHQGPHSATYPA